MLRRGAETGRRKSKLGSEALARLRRLVAELGVPGAAKSVGCSEQTVEELASGGFCLRRTVERVEARL